MGRFLGTGALSVDPRAGGGAVYVCVPRAGAAQPAGMGSTGGRAPWMIAACPPCGGRISATCTREGL